MDEKLTEENYISHFFRFEKRQAGISLVYCPEKEAYYYNAYCLEMELVKEIYTKEFNFLEDALEHINTEFPGWELVPYEKEKSGCSSCVAK